jgi:hypothetical protein
MTDTQAAVLLFFERHQPPGIREERRCRAGTACRRTPVGGVPALATGAALLVERRPEALAESIVTAVRGGDEVARLVEEGRRRAEAHRPEAVVSAHLTLYEDLCGVQTAGLRA